MLRGEHAVSEVDMRLETSGDRKSCFEAKRIATVQEKRDSEKRGPDTQSKKVVRRARDSLKRMLAGELVFMAMVEKSVRSLSQTFRVRLVKDPRELEDVVFKYPSFGRIAHSEICIDQVRCGQSSMLLMLPISFSGEAAFL